MSRHSPRSQRTLASQSKTPKTPKAQKPKRHFLIVQIDPKERAKFEAVCAKNNTTMSDSVRTYIHVRIGKEIK
jgi:hypothetical protein